VTAIDAQPFPSCSHAAGRRHDRLPMSLDNGRWGGLSDYIAGGDL
jgi:hypothetical protein